MGIKKNQIGTALGPFPIVLEEQAIPGATADAVKLYSKDVGGAAEFFVRDDQGNEVQVTSNGSLGLGGGSSLSYDWWNASSDASGGWTGSDSVANISFNALWNRKNKWSGNAGGIVATMPTPTSADHNRVLSFFEHSDSNSNAMTLSAGGGKLFRYPGSGISGPSSIQIQGPRSYVLVVYDHSPGQWTVIAGSNYIV